MAHTLLYLMGYNAPEDALLPRGFRLAGPDPIRRRLRRRSSTALRPWTIDFHVAQNDGTVHGAGSHDKTGRHCLATDPNGKLDIVRARRLLAPRRRRAVDQDHPPRLLGRLHVSQRRDDAAADVERYTGGDAGRARCARVEGIKVQGQRFKVKGRWEGMVLSVNDGEELRCESPPHSAPEEEDRRQYDLGERTARFGESIIEFAGSVRLTPITSPLINQLIRAATSIGANYCEASEAGSDKEFWYRISISNRESRETTYWLRMLARAVPPKKDRIRELWKEAHELNLIFASIFRKGKHRPHTP